MRPHPPPAGDGRQAGSGPGYPGHGVQHHGGDGRQHGRLTITRHGSVDDPSIRRCGCPVRASAPAFVCRGVPRLRCRRAVNPPVRGACAGVPGGSGRRRSTAADRREGAAAGGGPRGLSAGRVGPAGRPREDVRARPRAQAAACFLPGCNCLDADGSSIRRCGPRPGVPGGSGRRKTRMTGRREGADGRGQGCEGSHRASVCWPVRPWRRPAGLVGRPWRPALLCAVGALVRILKRAADTPVQAPLRPVG